MPGYYDRHLADRDEERRWLLALAGVPVDDPATPAERDLRLADNAPVSNVDPATGMRLRDVDVAANAAQKPQGAPNATPRGSTPVGDSERWETTNKADAERFDNEDQTRRQLALDRATDLRLQTGVVPEKYDGRWGYPPQTPSATPAEPLPAETPEQAQARRKAFQASFAAAHQGVPAIPAQGATPAAVATERAQNAAEPGTAPYEPPAARPESAKDDPYSFYTQTPETRVPEPRVQFNPFEARERARSLYGDNDAPKEGSHRWEEQFLSTHSQVSDRDIWREAFLKGVFGRDGDADASRKINLARQQNYADELAEARDRDRAEAMRTARISRGEAEALAASGVVSPETAVRMTRAEAEKILQGWQTGAYQFGSGIKRAETMAHLDELGLRRKAEDDERDRQQRQREAELRAQTERDKAEAERRAHDAKYPPSTPAREAAYIATHANVSKRIAELAASDGDLSHLPEAKRHEVELAREAWRNASQEEQSAMLTTQVKGEGRDRDAPIRESHSPKFVTKEENAYQEIAGPLEDAYQGALLLNKKLPLVAQFGTSSWAGLVQRGALTGEEQAAAAAINQLIDTYRKSQFGATLTGDERAQLEAGTGLATGDTTAFFRSPAVIMGFLNRLRAATARKRKLLDATTRQQPYGVGK